MAQKFDGLQYLASYPDLIEAFGADAAAGRQHYLQFGQHEGRRTDTFDEKQYLKNYHDLAVAFGQDGRAATMHYVQNGYFEGRTDEKPLPAGFDGLQYIASHKDLIQAFGANPSAGEQHYLHFGRAEGRKIDTFNENQYLANYSDLAAVFENNGGAATLHYILFGRAEGRTDDPLPTATDDAFGLSEDSAPTRLDVLANDHDNPVGRALTVDAVDDANTIGTVDLTTRGKILYEPGASFNHLADGQTATDGFAYTVENQAGMRDTATVHLTLTGTNDAPVAANDAFSLFADSGRFTFDARANDTDVDQGAVLTVVAVDDAHAAGTVEVGAGGVGIAYDPAHAFDHLTAGETATDSFTYKIADEHGFESTATATMTVTGVDELPSPLQIAASDFLL